MPGKRTGGKPGPPFGSMNNVTYPWRVFWRKRALKPEDRWIVPFVERYMGDLESDKGGPESITAGEKRMIEIASIARACTMLILQKANKHGFDRQLDGTWDLTPGLKELPKFLTAETRALTAVGLDRRSRQITWDDFKPSNKEPSASREDETSPPVREESESEP
jgi:hypothetical protein